MNFLSYLRLGKEFTNLNSCVDKMTKIRVNDGCYFLDSALFLDLSDMEDSTRCYEVWKQKKMAETVDFSIQWEKVRMPNQGRGTGQIYRTSFQMQELMGYILLSSHRRGLCYISTGLCWIRIWKRWTYSSGRLFRVLFLLEVRFLYWSCYCPIRELSWNLCNQELWGMPDERKETGHGL